MKVSIISFNPTGGTFKSAAELASSMGEIIQSIDLTDSELAQLTVSDEADAALVCDSHCPAQAICHDEPAKIDETRCIGCMRYVAICPAKAKHLPTAKRLLVHAFLSATANKRKEPQLYI